MKLYAIMKYPNFLIVDQKPINNLLIYTPYSSFGINHTIFHWVSLYVLLIREILFSTSTSLPTRVAVPPPSLPTSQAFRSPANNSYAQCITPANSGQRESRNALLPTITPTRIAQLITPDNNLRRPQSHSSSPVTEKSPQNS